MKTGCTPGGNNRGYTVGGLAREEKGITNQGAKKSYIKKILNVMIFEPHRNASN